MQHFEVGPTIFWQKIEFKKDVSLNDVLTYFYIMFKLFKFRTRLWSNKCCKSMIKNCLDQYAIFKRIIFKKYFIKLIYFHSTPNYVSEVIEVGPFLLQS